MGKIEKIEKYTQKGKAGKLVSLTHDKDKSVCLAAIRGLGKMADKEDAQNTLIGLLDSDDLDIREAAVTALGGATGSYVETRLRYCLSHETDERILKAVRNSLANIKK